MPSLSRAVIAVALLVAVCLTACGSPDTDAEPTATVQATQTQQPTTTITPQAVALVTAIVVAEWQSDILDYDRDDWKHWTDSDGDCQDTRQEVLIEESSISVTFVDDRMCRVASGSWTDPYTGVMTEDPSGLDIDHLVPLANAHDSGGHAWDRDRKERFANNLLFAGHLIAATASANRTKGRKGPEEWRPTDQDYWCQYAVDWITVKREWELTATQAEVDALREMLDTCDHATTLQTIEAENGGETLSVPTPSPPATTLSPMPTAPSGAAADDLSEQDLNCSDFERWEDAQQSFEEAGGPDLDPHRLDIDGNGIACESLPGSLETAFESTPTPIANEESDSVDLLYDPEGPDRNCSDFERWEDAQRFFEASGGPDSDPHRLDRDNNGVACESLPGAP